MTTLLKSIGLAGLAGLAALTALAPMPAAAQPYRYYGPPPGYYYAPPPRPYYRRYYRYDPGPAIAGSIIGGVFGAIAGSAIRGGSSHVARCERAYRSYVPATDSYTGYDGLRHRCLL